MSETPATYAEHERRMEATHFADGVELDLHKSDLPSAEEARRLAISKDILTQEASSAETLSFTEQAVRYLAGVSANIQAARAHELVQ